jgi:putative tricarboxylic transport membrane protein
MWSIENLLNGFVIAISPGNMFACFGGVFLGTIVGVLPGLGVTATMALMLPITVQYGPTIGLIMLAGIWYGAHYGGSTTSILVNIPGEASSVVTCIDGYQMAKNGRAGAALSLVAIGSWAAGTFGVIALQLFAPALAQSALAFGPSEYLALMILAFVFLSNLAGDAPLKGVIMIMLGLWLGLIGVDPVDGTPRFASLIPDLISGIEFVPMAMGLFGLAEVLTIVADTYVPKIVEHIRLRDLYPTRNEVRRSIAPILRGSILGFLVGLLPGPTATISSFVSYSVEKRLSKTPEEFGKGMVEGVVGPESANNSAVCGSLVPLLALGIPFSPPSAVLLAGLMIHNVEPGPFLFQQAPQLFWGFIASMYIGNVMLLILNLPLVGFFARISTLRPQWLMPFVGIICLIGAYSTRNDLFDVWVMIVAGILGFYLRRWRFPVAPLLIGLVLGPITEKSFRQASILFKGNFLLMIERPITLSLLLMALVFLIFIGLRGKKLPSTMKVEQD